VDDCLRNGTLYRRTEIEALTPQGHQRWLGATIAPIEFQLERGPHGALCLLMDITEVTELREQVALKKNLESLGEMSAGLAHEFKNAVAALHGYVQLLQTLDLNDKAQTAAASLLNEVRSLSTMVTAFLNFARPQPLQVEEVALDELLSDCAEELAPLYRETQVELRISHDEKPLRVAADERMLRQSFLNLLRNAAEAIPEGKEERLVLVRSTQDRDLYGKSWAHIEIRDTGSGIAPAQLQKIFIPFFTTKPKGHGVGLALTHRVITEHGGTLTAANNSSGGAQFTLRLPM